MNIAMIPARMGSQRLKKKNLRELAGIPLITRAIRKCRDAGVFDEIWVNSEDDEFGRIAEEEGVQFHKRPAELADNSATHEQFVHEFLQKHPCNWIFQVHSIAPLLTADEVRTFVQAADTNEYEVLLSVVHEQIECAMNNQPLNFSLDQKENSQDLDPIQRITWSITGWNADAFVSAFEDGKCATYAGRLGFIPINRAAGHIIKTEEDLQIAEALLAIDKSE